jgi:PBP1b-binding outer membrane lipoprotein LpoB
MFKNKSYIGISFIILFWNLCSSQNYIRIQNNEIVQGDRLDQ